MSAKHETNDRPIRAIDGNDCPGSSLMIIRNLTVQHWPKVYVPITATQNVWNVYLRLELTLI